MLSPKNLLFQSKHVNIIFENTYYSCELIIILKICINIGDFLSMLETATSEYAPKSDKEKCKKLSLLLIINLKLHIKLLLIVFNIITLSLLLYSSSVLVFWCFIKFFEKMFRFRTPKHQNTKILLISVFLLKKL